MAESSEAWPATVTRRTTRRRNGTKYLLGGVLFAVAVAYLIYSAAQGAGVYYHTIGEVKAGAAGSSQVRVVGKVVGGTIDYDAKSMILRFTMADGGETMPVVYKGVLPDAFMADADVIVEGRYVAGQPFEAKELLTKCPSKYEAADSAVPQQQSGR